MRLCLALVLACVLLVAPASAVEWPEPDGAAHAFPTMLDSAGRRIGSGEFRQWLEGGALHVAIAYDLGGDHHVEEKAVFRQRRGIAQERWSWREMRGKRAARAFSIDLTSGEAESNVDEGGGPKTTRETLKLQPAGEVFAGFGFSLAIRGLRERLLHGEHVMLQAVGFTPKPQAVSVEISYAGRDRVRTAERTIQGERFVIHPKVPAIARLFVKVPDETIWLTMPPAGFLQFEGPLATPSDQVIRIVAF